jgi:hypothetical protein
MIVVEGEELKKAEIKARLYNELNDANYTAEELRYGEAIILLKRLTDEQARSK